jgi:hypothetical protein
MFPDSFRHDPYEEGSRVVVLCGQNDYVIRRAYRRAQPVVGARVDQTLHIILCAFLCAPPVR